MVPVLRLGLLLLSLSSALPAEAGQARDLVEWWKPTRPTEVYKVSRLANFALSLNSYGRPTYDILGKVMRSEKRVDGLDTIYRIGFTTYPTLCPTTKPLNAVNCKRAGHREVRACEADIFENHDGKDLRLTRFECGPLFFGEEQ